MKKIILFALTTLILSACTTTTNTTPIEPTTTGTMSTTEDKEVQDTLKEIDDVMNNTKVETSTATTAK